MIDWSKINWNTTELQGIAEIRILPRIVPGELIAIQTKWLDSSGNTVREDSHIEGLKPLELFAHIEE